MLYSALTDGELERWSHNSPRDHKAKAELLRRAVRIAGTYNEYIDELETQITALEDRVERLNEELNNYIE